MAISLLLPQFFFFFKSSNFSNLIAIIQFLFLFLVISLQKFIFLPLLSYYFSLLSPLSYFFLEFRQWYYQNSLLSSYFQINLNSNHITNKTAVFTIFSQKTHCVFSSIIDPTGSLNYWQVLHTHKSFEVLVKKIIWSCSHLQRDFLL